MQSAGTDSAREELRALIEQQTKEYEQSNGPIETLELIKRTERTDDWNRPRSHAASAVKDPVADAIAERYPNAECLDALAAELGIASANALTKRALKMGVKRERINNPLRAKSVERMEEVGKLIDAGQPVKAISQEIGVPERTIRYYRQRLEQINKDADAVEQKINRIEARIK